MLVSTFLADSAAESRTPTPLGRVADDTLGLLHQAIALVLLLLAPLMLGVAWRIWRVDGAPIFFGHHRVGREGRLFRCLKFRTMRRDAEQVLAGVLANDPVLRTAWERDQKLPDDPRITPVGHFLRKTSLDELPQLINVLRGEMRLVGPRPITRPELTRYGRVRWLYMQVPPGITGLWQVSGRNCTTYAERVALDQAYINAASPLLDLKILLRTVAVVVTGHGAG